MHKMQRIQGLRKPWFFILLFWMFMSMVNLRVEATCFVSSGCDALAMYITSSNDTLYTVAQRFGIVNWQSLATANNIQDYNNITVGELIRIPFTCQCVGDSLGHNFSYSVKSGDDDTSIATQLYSNLTKASWIDAYNPGSSILDPGQVVIVPINCSCGDPDVSLQYGYFGTYPAQPTDNLSSLSTSFNVSEALLKAYNPTVSFDPLTPYTSILFIPSKNSSTGQYPPFTSTPSTGGKSSKTGTIAGAVTGGAAAFVLVIGLVLWAFCAKRKHRKTDSDGKQISLIEDGFKEKTSSSSLFDTSSKDYSIFHPVLPDDRCTRFTLSELTAMTGNFCVANEIGKGGFATVYYGERHGQKLAIKKMATKETKEFMNELRILSSVHHANLLGLVGYCTEEFLFLIYEYVENGTLTQKLRSVDSILSWEKRIQIALDAARGIEYIHDYTRPTYIHRDLKPSNILLDNNYHAKVGDFGLTRLMSANSEGFTNTLGRYGTFGYMAPEYAQFGQVSVKIDVYAFGVILFQLVSGKDALVSANRQLVTVFEDILNKTDATELKSLIDPALGSDYCYESIYKMVNLAARCTQVDPELRPPMKEVVMELMMISQLNDSMH